MVQQLGVDVLDDPYHLTHMRGQDFVERTRGVVVVESDGFM